MKRTLSILALSSAALFALTDSAQNDTTTVPGVKPIEKWTFEGKEPGIPEKGAKTEPNGPQPPIHPNFTKDNKALNLNGNSQSLVVKESDFPEENFRFTNGDTITLEAWIYPSEVKNNGYLYIIGKGRNRNPEFTSENQNWALRLDGKASPSFLFRSRDPETKAEEYHRWTASKGIATGGWHHVALTYTFGKPESIAAYVNGEKVTQGIWDMAGPTKLPPVTDADNIVIGSGNRGGAGNSFNGALDEVAIYRGPLPDAVIASRYVFVPPPPSINPDEIPAGKVIVQICEKGVPTDAAWPKMEPQATETYVRDAFGFHELPHKYVSTGVRGDRPLPLFLRTAAKITLPKGKHRLLMRGRGATRLSIDGEQMMITEFPSSDLQGHGRISSQNDFLDLGDPDFRFIQPGDHEAWIEYNSDGKEHLFVFEKMIGTNGMRPELGELVLAVSLEGTEEWQLVSPGKTVIPYNDESWQAYHAKEKAWLAGQNAKLRAAAREKHAAYWTKRREAASAYLASTEDVPVPDAIPGMAALNAIDHFINAKIKEVEKQYQEIDQKKVNFYREILPIFENKCFSCHQGGKTKGGLKLDSRIYAFEGGKEDGPGIVPGDAHDSAIFLRVTDEDEDYVMPPKGDKLTKNEVELLEKWINEGAHWPDMDVQSMEITALSDDLTFLRRIFLDTVGVPPTLNDIEDFTADTSKDKRTKIIDKLLEDPRWADKWMGYWQDVLAENPNIINPTLNNTGPFRWWIRESLLDNKPMDLIVTELIRMDGSNRFGGPAGFGVATGNDAPMAAKGTIVSSAFMGVEMKCARCHDAPAHTYLQQDLFEIAAMLQTSPIKVPTTSSVPMDKLHQGGRKSLIEVTLKPGTTVKPAWPFEKMISTETGKQLAENPSNTRDLLAALITAPQNERFALVGANRVWKQIMSRGIVDTVEDWQKSEPTHPELMKWLGREFVRSGYDMKAIARLIFTSHTYQRASDPTLLRTSPVFNAPAPRRLSAEQIVDSLFHATGKRFNTEEVSLDIDGKRRSDVSIKLGKPNRSWMLSSTSNERDRPSLSLPRIQAVADVLEAFGWRGARQDATSIRETDPSALQPAIIANGTVGIWLTRLSDDHPLTALSLTEQPAEKLLDELFLKLLILKPTEAEKKSYLPFILDGYDTRIVENPAPAKSGKPRGPEKYVTWSNHLDPEADIVRQQQTFDARAGDPPTNKLQQDWRNRFEDVLWAIINSPEWIYLQ